MTKAKKTNKPKSTKVTKNSDGNSEDAKAKSLANLKPFQPGQSGNPAGRPAGSRNVATLFKEAFEEYNLKLVEEASKKDKSKKITLADVDAERDIIVKTIDQARAGDPKAREVILDRLYGKATQPIQMAGVLANLNTDEMTSDEAIAEVMAWQEKWTGKPTIDENDSKSNKTTNRKRVQK